MNLSASQTRVLGCLLEKQHTTPDMYPLTLNSLRLACNQSTNREPVVEYDDELIRDALHRLERQGLTRLASGRGRAPKYRHLLAEALPMSEDEQAIVCVLMLRGPQTPGELKQRADRMHAFSSLDAVHGTLERLIARTLVLRLERRPGQKEERYRQLLEDPDSVEETGAASPPASTTATGAGATYSPVAVAPGGGAGSAAPGASGAIANAPYRTDLGDRAVEGIDSQARVEDLEERVATLERAVTELRETLRTQVPS